MSDPKPPLTAPPFMHDVNLGERLGDEKRARVIFDHRSSELVFAIMQTLRDAAAEARRTSTECSKNERWADRNATTGQITTGPMDDPTFHSGAGQACEDLFWQMWQWMQGETETENDTKA